MAEGLPRQVACCHCGQPAQLGQTTHQGVMMTEDGREVDHPLSTALYHCAHAHVTQAIYFHDEAFLKVQEFPEAIIF